MMIDVKKVPAQPAIHESNAPKILKSSLSRVCLLYSLPNAQSQPSLFPLPFHALRYRSRSFADLLFTLKRTKAKKMLTRNEKIRQSVMVVLRAATDACPEKSCRVATVSSGSSASQRRSERPRSLVHLDHSANLIGGIRTIQQRLLRRGRGDVVVVVGVRIKTRELGTWEICHENCRINRLRRNACEHRWSLWIITRNRLLFAKVMLLADETDSDCSSSSLFGRTVADVVDRHRCRRGRNHLRRYMLSAALLVVFARCCRPSQTSCRHRPRCARRSWWYGSRVSTRHVLSRLMRQVR